MLEDAASALAGQGTNVSRRILIPGLSASGSFASRFAMLHPDRVLAVAAGSPGGWPIVPVAKDGGSALPYPVGIDDLKSLAGTTPALSSLRRVAWFFFLGDRDTNDSVPYRDSFSKADESLISQRFGSSPVTRWKEAERSEERRVGKECRSRRWAERCKKKKIERMNECKKQYKIN